MFFYRQHKPDGTVVEAYWLTNFPGSTVGPPALFRMAKSRWEIENQGFNDAKSRHGLEHICRHHANSLLIAWLLTMLALTIERLYRLRYLHCGKHRVHSSAQLLLLATGQGVRNPAYIRASFSGILNCSEIVA